jgi:hypothetical protein
MSEFRQLPSAYSVRFKGCEVAGVRSGLSNRPLLLRKRKAEAPFIMPIDWFFEEAAGNKILAANLARLECARAIKRTEYARRVLQGNHMLRGIPAVERLLRDYQQTRRGKRWKICQVSGFDKEGTVRDNSEAEGKQPEQISIIP